jgi:hypothetical protein
MTGNIRILGQRLILRGNGLLRKFSVTRKRFDGRLQSLDREIYDPAPRFCSMIQAARGSFSSGSFA